MRKYRAAILAIIFTILCAWIPANHKELNSNSWSVRINQKEILDWKNNEMGDTAVVEWSKLKMTDTLFVQRFLCGFNGQNSVTTLTIKDQYDQVITQAVNHDNSWMFTAEIQLSEILTAHRFRAGQALGVFFSIADKNEKLNETVLLGRLKIK